MTPAANARPMRFKSKVIARKAPIEPIPKKKPHRMSSSFERRVGLCGVLYESVGLGVAGDALEGRRAALASSVSGSMPKNYRVGLDKANSCWIGC